MSPVIPWYVAPIVLLMDLFLVIYLSRLVIRATAAAGLDSSSRLRVSMAAVGLLGAWFVVALLTARSAPTLDASGLATTPITFPLFIAGALVTGLLGLRIPAWRRTVDALPNPSLVRLQLFRLVGALFLVLLAAGVLPAPFATTAGWGDIAVALTAPVVALLLLRRAPLSRGIAIAWNALGVFDLVLAVGLGTGRLLPLLFPGSVPEAAPAMGMFPLALVPTFAVPLALLLHLYSLRLLLRRVEPIRASERFVPA